MNVHTAALMTMELLPESIVVERDDTGASLEHAHWMLHGIASGYVQHDKAHRWLGYAQAIIVLMGVASLECMKDVNKEAK